MPRCNLDRSTRRSPCWGSQGARAALKGQICRQLSKARRGWPQRGASPLTTFPWRVPMFGSKGRMKRKKTGHMKGIICQSSRPTRNLCLVVSRPKDDCEGSQECGEVIPGIDHHYGSLSLVSHVYLVRWNHADMTTPQIAFLMHAQELCPHSVTNPALDARQAVVHVEDPTSCCQERRQRPTASLPTRS